MSTNYKSADGEGFDRFVRPEFDPGSNGFQVSHDTDWSWTVTTTLVFSLSSITTVAPTDMLPLNRAVDPDVLDQHVRGRDRGAELTFEFHGYRITVRDSGHITFSSLEDQQA
ncbi:hypothetical protein Halru_2221 [Halovivax ruber XH-70]|uniref:Halobacterial output domain-containing protein n=1 Tax=Halovivax ruber (strain DSM 18193 / JCM 13892 / XH-70) TaxID=797302 RepID=L0IDC6_HALRX|nr:hypothetical protein Halru_2221 [Halovivax ruber XH-70]